MSDDSVKVKFYGTSWCYSSRKARGIFDQNNIQYDWFDIDYDEEARKFVEETNHGYRSVPTIVFPDGTIMVEPTADELAAKLGLS